MEGRILLALLACCVAAVEPSILENANLGIPGSELEPGFYLNRHFQQDKAQARGDLNDLNVIVDDSGRTWVVAELPEPEPGFYLNRDFQDKKEVKSTALKQGDNQVFLVKSNPTSNGKKIEPVNVAVKPVRGSVTFGESTRKVPKAQPNFYTVFSSNGAVTDSSSPSQSQRSQKVPAQQPAGRRTEPQSFVVRQMLNRNQNAASSVVSQSTGQEKALRVQQTQRQSTAQQTSQKKQGTGKFSCEGKPYGYYADVESNCQMYHICHPVTLRTTVRYQKFSFHCGIGTQWDQLQKVCLPTSQASACQ